MKEADHQHDYQHYHFYQHHHDDHQTGTWQMATVRRRARVGSLRDERTPIGLMIGMIPSCFSVYMMIGMMTMMMVINMKRMIPSWIDITMTSEKKRMRINWMIKWSSSGLNRWDDIDQVDDPGEPGLDVIRMRISLMLEILEMIRMMFKIITITRINIITLAMDWRSLGAPVRDWSPAPKVERREPTSITWGRSRGEFFTLFLLALFFYPEVGG